MADSPPPQPRRGLGFLLPGLAGYDAANLPRDLLAGCVLAGLLVPQGLGYAGIAGVELQRGLYAAAAGLLAYAALGTSRHLVVSPTSSSAAMLAAAVAPIAGADAATYGALGAAVALGTGMLLGLGGVLRLGFVSDFIAKPVLKGFTFGLALRIIVKQAAALLGVGKASANVFEQAWGVLRGLGSAHAPTLVTGLATLALLIALPRIVRGLPPALVALVGGISAVAFFGLRDLGVPVVGNVPTGLPTPALPRVG